MVLERGSGWYSSETRELQDPPSRDYSQNRTGLAEIYSEARECELEHNMRLLYLIPFDKLRHTLTFCSCFVVCVHTILHANTTTMIHLHRLSLSRTHLDNTWDLYWLCYRHENEGSEWRANTTFISRSCYVEDKGLASSCCLPCLKKNNKQQFLSWCRWCQH